MTKTKLIAVTSGANELMGKGAQEVISFVARVSNPSNQLNFDTAPRLLKYCIQHKHWSVFEHAFMTVEIETSRAIAAQVLRHKSFYFQEFSQRYSEAPEINAYPARRQDTKNRQNSIDDLPEETKQAFLGAQKEVAELSMKRYKEALAMGVAKEQARFLLPLSTKTTIYMTGNIRSWIHYIELRSANGTQLEHAEIANKCKEIFKEQFPDVAEALGW
jgi:thymidylate synthase (FAD)